VTKTADESRVNGTDAGNTPLLGSLAIVEADDWLSAAGLRTTSSRVSAEMGNRLQAHR